MKKCPGIGFGTISMALLLAAGCNSEEGIRQGSGGAVSSGGAAGKGSGGTQGSGRAVGSGGAQGSGGAPGSGGSVGSGGAPTGGSSATGGVVATGGNKVGTGGATSTGGGVSSGGTASTGDRTGVGGNANTGGITSTGGVTNLGGATNTGGTQGTGGVANTGGTSSLGGAATGGIAKGGAGGSGTGGSTTACALPTPPSNISTWVDASWNAQLGDNVRNLKRWLLDNAYQGKGQINVCVRWGATSAPSKAEQTDMATYVGKWFNLWFATLDGDGCFPYSKITTVVTGWAVKPGNTGWLTDIDAATAKVYTELDGGEPNCPAACSFFKNNGAHAFPNCPGGEAFHNDYWMWIDDTNVAAAEGGDWGLRMPVASLHNAVKAINYDVNTVVHEMGHGFGFQDYYDWTGPKPAGGSLMILDTEPIAPTEGDKWLMKRLAYETKKLRGW